MLLQFEEQQNIKPISDNNQDKYYQIADEVENFEFRELLGVELLIDMQENELNYTDLLTGCTFTLSGKTYKHRGLKFVLAYLNYSKYIGNSFINDTFSGFFQATRPDAQPISEGAIKRMQNEVRSIALSEFEIIKKYMCEIKLPLWYNVNKSVYTPKFEFISKTQYNGDIQNISGQRRKHYLDDCVCRRNTL